MDRVGKLNTTLSMDRVGKLSTTLSMDRVVECKFYREICRNSEGFILRSKYICKFMENIEFAKIFFAKFTLELLKVDINCFHRPVPIKQKENLFFKNSMVEV